MIGIIINEWIGLWRNSRLRWLMLFFLLILVALGYFGVQDVNKRQSLISDSKSEIRNQWENMGPSNPHGAAHYGSYAFKPISPLSALDEGVNLSSGRVLRLEGHVQNELVHSSQSQAIFSSYFGPLKASLILQIIIPLILVFLTFYTIRSEQEQGRLNLLLVQGQSVRRIFFGKALAIWILSFILLLVFISSQWILFRDALNGDLLLRSSLLIIAYAVFYWIIISLSSYFCSVWNKNSSSLTFMLAIWILWTIFIPKLSGWYINESNSLPSREEFSSAMREDRSKGIDGHNPRDDREQALKDSIMAVYGVNELDSLPINYDGILMQADEEYGNKVWDKHFGSLFDILQRQKSGIQFFGIINPFQSLRSLSMGICGTDQQNHLHFQKEAETYRRVFIKALNDEHAYGGSKNGDWSWKAEQSFYNQIEDFHYKTPAFSHFSAIYMKDWLFLGFWFLLSLLSFYTIKSKI